jgi:glycosyltransferase involved in cell wall biosynthesis
VTTSRPRNPEFTCLRHDHYDCIVICSNYPGIRFYAGEFIRARVKAYANAGLIPLVLEVNSQNAATRLDDVDGVECLRIEPRSFRAYICDLKGRTTLILSHAPKPFILNELICSCEPSKIMFWFHGAEARDYRRMYFNYSTEEIEKNRERHNFSNKKRWKAIYKCFSDESIKKVFVSDYIRCIAQEDVGCEANNAYVIHNFIDEKFYVYNKKNDVLLKKVLLIRSFQSYNYANDIAIEAIRILSKREGFGQLSFTICGFGAQFSALTQIIAPLSNITINEGCKNPEQMKQLHSQHGVFLCPSRFDTQGVTMGEAMASGLVCITNRVAAIPEFADDSCAVLVRPNDPQSYAEAIWRTAHNPGWAEGISRSAGSRVREQCGYDQTIARELHVLNTAMSNCQSLR